MHLCRLSALAVFSLVQLVAAPRAAAQAATTAGQFAYTAPNMFSGSVFDLEPDTDYEVRLTLSDPDGVKGETQTIIEPRRRTKCGGHTRIFCAPLRSLRPVRFKTGSDLRLPQNLPY